MSKLTRKQVSQAIVEGMVLANLDHAKWSGGYWIADAGVEGFVSSKIAERIHDRIKCNSGVEAVGLEWSIKYLFDEKATASSKTSLVGTRPSDRADIAVWNDASSAHYLIEVKRHWNNTPVYGDFVRSTNYLLNYGLIETGELEAAFFCFMFSASPGYRKLKKISEKRLVVSNTIEKWFRENVPKQLSSSLRYEISFGSPMTYKAKSDEDEDWRKHDGMQGQAACVSMWLEH